MKLKHRERMKIKLDLFFGAKSSIQITCTFQREIIYNSEKARMVHLLWISK